MNIDERMNFCSIIAFRLFPAASILILMNEYCSQLTILLLFCLLNWGQFAIKLLEDNSAIKFALHRMSDLVLKVGVL